MAAKPVDYQSPRGAALPGGIGEDRGADLVRWLFPAYIFMILLGFFALRAPGVSPKGNEITPDRAVFTSVNAATLTGFGYSISPTQFFLPGKIILLVMTVLATLFALIVGGLAVKRILRLAWPDQRIYGAAFVIEAFVLLIGLIAPRRDGDHWIVGGLLQAAAAWGNSGLTVQPPPAAGDMFTHVVLLPLALLGGLGLVVLLQIFDALWNRIPLLRHSRVVLQMTAALFLIGFVGCVILQVMDLEALGWKPGGGSMAGRAEHWPAALRRLFPEIITNASVTSLNARTAGMNIVPVGSFPRAMSFFVMLLMMAGASPGGTGGGLKTTTIYEVLRAPRRALRGMPLTRTTGIAFTWLGIYLIAAAVLQMLLLWAEPQMPADRVLFVAISALSNVGMSHDVLSMTRASLLLVSAAMFFGRIAPLLILWWMVDTTHDADVAVG